jgi:hypothetical protein
MSYVSQEHGSPYLPQHVPVVVEETMAAGVTRARALVECVVDRYHHRCQITDRQLAAGLRFRSLWRGASLPASVTGSYGERRGGGSGIDGNTDARHALQSAIVGSGIGQHFGEDAPILVATLSGERYEPLCLPVRLRLTGHVVVSVCGLDEWAGGTRRLDKLREGLSDLANYWRMESE